MSIKYTPPEMAAEIIGNRRADDKLQQRYKKIVKDILPEDPYSDTSDNPPAVRAEYLARPTRGDLEFLELAIELGFTPWTVTYEQDSFVSSNEKKSTMARPRLALPKDQMVKLKTPSLDEGCPIGDLYGGFGVKLSTLWLGMRRFVFERESRQECVPSVYDISEWYQIQASLYGWERASQSKAKYYYKSLLGLYAARAALFTQFSEGFDYPEPAFEAVAEELGVEPVIVEWSPKTNYPQHGIGKRHVGQNEVDLTDMEGLNASNIPQWIEEEVL